MKPKRYVALLAVAAALVAAPTHAATIFSHDFENAPSPGTAVTAVADLGAPAAGSFSFSGSPVGGIGGARRALAVGNNENSNVANMTEMSANNVTFDAIVDPVNFSFPETQVADAGGGDLVFADFASAGGVNGGASTEISFRWASFGNNNTGQFKYQFVRGLDASDNELFELLLVSGSGQGIRQLYARGADDDSTTLNAANDGTPEGTLLADNFQFNLNGTNVANGRPDGTYTISILLENGTVTYDVGASGGTFSTTAANGAAMALNSAATTISRLEFSSVWNASVDGQNKGYWVDDIVVTTVPEPTGFALALMAPALAALARRRR